MTEPLPPAASDLDAYFARIGYRGSQNPTLETLGRIVAHHTAAIPFENITPLLKQPVLLDMPSLVEKLLHAGRGGYCFEQNLLLRHILLGLGYQVTCLAARVRWNVPDHVITPRGHMLLRVDLEEGAYIVDAGFGGLTLTAPLQLVADVEQSTSHEPFRLLADEDGYVMQARINGDWKAIYRFDLQAQQVVDYEVTNWYLSNHPNSHFVTGLMAARPDVNRRYALHNNRFAVHHLNGTSERHVLSTVEELRATLEDAFCITLPNTPALEPALQRLVEQPE